jgi:LicD family protein
LHGVSTVTVRSSATGEDLASGTVAFGGSGRVAITDAQGRWLAMNKWNRLGPSFDGDPSGVQDRMLESAALIATQLQEWGYPVYIVGGTLLGAMRSGDLLPHDDDIDFAFWCDKSDPQDVTLVSFELERRLVAAGYTVSGTVTLIWRSSISRRKAAPTTTSTSSPAITVRTISTTSHSRCEARLAGRT